MNNSEPLIKIVPSDPSTSSILIVYCYINNKPIPCQAKWTKILNSQIEQLKQLKNKDLNIEQSGMTYKCTPLDFNHLIEVEAVCEFQGKQYKLHARTQSVKISKQLIQKRNIIKSINCKIKNNNIDIECRISLEVKKFLHLISGPNQLNLILSTNDIHILSSKSFKTIIQNYSYEFIRFFCDSYCKRTTQGNKSITDSNQFQFTFNTDVERDITLLQIVQSNLQKREYRQNSNPESTILIKNVQYNKNIKPNNQSTSLNFISESSESHTEARQIKQNQFNQDQKSQKTKRSLNEFSKKMNSQTHKYVNKKQKNPLSFTTPDHKKTSTQSYNSSFNVILDDNSITKKKNEKIKISQKLLLKKSQMQNASQKQVINNGCGNNQVYSYQAIHQSVNTQNKKKPSNQHEQRKRQFLNIFDEDQTTSEPQINMQNSSPNIFGESTSKQKYHANRKQTKNNKDDLPSINLRSSFEQLDKIYMPDGGSTKNIKQKDKNQLNSQQVYKYPKNRQQTQKIISSTQQSSQTLKRQLNQLKKQNIQLKKQIQSLYHMKKQNNSLKKKQYLLSEQVNRLEVQKREILADKLKCEANFNKQKAEKEKIKLELQKLQALIEVKNKEPKQMIYEVPYINKAQNKTQSKQKQIRKFLQHPHKKQQQHTDQTIKKTLYQGDLRQKSYSYKSFFTNHENHRNLQANTSPTLSTLNRGNTDSHSQSRKEIRFPSYSYNYSSNNPFK